MTNDKLISALFNLNSFVREFKTSIDYNIGTNSSKLFLIKKGITSLTQFFNCIGNKNIKQNELKLFESLKQEFLSINENTDIKVLDNILESLVILATIILTEPYKGYGYNEADTDRINEVAELRFGDCTEHFADLYWHEFYSDFNNYGQFINFSLPFVNSNYVKSKDFKDSKSYYFHAWLKEIYVAIHELNYYELIDKQNMRSVLGLKRIIVKVNNLLNRFFNIEVPEDIKPVQEKYMKLYGDMQHKMDNLASWDFEDVLQVKRSINKLVFSIIREIGSTDIDKSKINFSDIDPLTYISGSSASINFDSNSFSDKDYDAILNSLKFSCFSNDFFRAVINTLPKEAIDTNYSGKGFKETMVLFNFNPFLISVGLSVLMTSLNLGSMIKSSILTKKMNVKSLKEKLIELKENNDRVFKARINPEINAIIKKYKADYDYIIKNDYKIKIDSLEMKDLTDLFKKLNNLNIKLSREIKRASKTKNFAIDPEDKLIKELESISFSISNTMSDSIDNKLNKINVYRIGSRIINMNAYKRALVETKKEIDKFFNSNTPKEMEKEKKDLESRYENFIDNMYNKKAGSNNEKDLETIQKGLTGFGEYIISLLKEHTVNFSEETIKDLQNRILNSNKLINNGLALFSNNEIVNKYKNEYQVINNYILENFNNNNKNNLYAQINTMTDFMTDFKRDMTSYAPINNFVYFSDILDKYNIDYNFSMLETRNELSNTLRLVFKEIPNVSIAPDLYKELLQLQTDHFEEPLGSNNVKHLISKLEYKNESELEDINTVFRSFLKRIRAFNKENANPMIDNHPSNLYNERILSNRNDRNNKYNKNSLDPKEWNKLERFIASTGRALKSNLPMLATGLAAGVSLKKLRGYKV